MFPGVVKGQKLALSWSLMLKPFCGSSSRPSFHLVLHCLLTLAKFFVSRCTILTTYSVIVSFLSRFGAWNGRDSVYGYCSWISLFRLATAAGKASGVSGLHNGRGLRTNKHVFRRLKAARQTFEEDSDARKERTTVESLLKEAVKKQIRIEVEREGE